jgi:hypothetical protein
MMILLQQNKKDESRGIKNVTTGVFLLFFILIEKTRAKEKTYV